MSNRRDRPGYQRGAKRTDGTAPHYWNPRRAISGAPANLPIIRLPENATDQQIIDQCVRLTDELREELISHPSDTRYDGRVASLIECYRTDETSPYQRVKFSTRTMDYDTSLRLIRDTVGKRAVHRLKGSDFQRWFGLWAAPIDPESDPRLRRAKGAVKMLRAIFSYGASERLPHCAQAREILSLMEFKSPKPRTVKLTYEQARAIILTAIGEGRPSIAMTQATQWATALRRINVIGEWVPLAKDEAPTGIVRGRTRWIGPTARQLSKDLVFTLESTAKGGAGTRFDLSMDDLVLLALEHYHVPETGPIIISEETGMPYRDNKYSHAWREIANLAGVPTNVRSMDSRAGAISEAEEVMGIEAARKMATHTNSKTTARYVRNDPLDNNREIARRRSKLRD